MKRSRCTSCLYTIRLDGRTRFSLVDQQGTGDLLGRPQNHLWALFADNKARSDVRRLVFNAFGKHFVSDPTQMQLFKIRMSDRAPSSDTEEQALDKKARGFHSKALPITEFGEGTQAFVGLISALLSLPQKIMLIDEPDAFLHPPLARRLGMNLVQLSQERDASLVVATHRQRVSNGLPRIRCDYLYSKTYFRKWHRNR